jgi:DNA primase
MTVGNKLGMSDRSDIERVRDQVDLVALISEYIPLKQSSREWVGLCPFHDDHKPSMRVVTHKEQAFYKCFSCGASGDCFQFVQEYLQKDFGEALRFLADRTGIELQSTPSEDGISSRSAMRRAMDWASNLYREALTTTDEGATALTQLHDRGFTDASIAHFSIGVAPHTWTFLTEKLQSHPERIETGLDAGLLKKNDEKNRVYDAFRHRIMFPILDETGSTIAFGGRRLDETDEPKYINSPETILFHKSKTLYGYYQARPAIQKENKTIVVEGYTDVIACHQAGITNVVATLGTSLTTDHADKLSRVCNEVILVFDGDSAGQLAADRAIECFFLKNIDVFICVLPDGQDPADLVADVTNFTTCVDGAVDALTYKFNRLKNALSQEKTISGKSQRIDSFLDEMTRLGVEHLSNSRKSFVYERIATLLHIPMEDVQKELQSRRPASSIKKTQENTREIVQLPKTLTRARQIAEREFLAILLFDPTEASACLRESKLAVTVESFVDPISAKIAEYIFPKLLAGTLFTMPDLITDLDEEGENVATTLYFVGQRICKTYESVVYAMQMTMNAFVQSIEKQAIEDEVKGIHEVIDVEEKTQAAQQAIESIRRQQAARNAS